MFDIPFADIREHIDSDIIARQFAEGDRCHELGGVCRHDAVDISPFLAELAHETGCFESGDPAADSYDNVLIFKHHACVPLLKNGWKVQGSTGSGGGFAANT